MKGAACADRTLDPDFTTHHLNKLLTDGESKTGTAILTGGRAVCLAEGFKKFFLLLLRQANPGIFYSEMEFG